MKLIEADIQDIFKIQDIALKTWPITYNHILSKDQIEYMLDMMYSTDSLTIQMIQLEHHFLLITTTNSDVFKGFISFEYNYAQSNCTKIHKLYILPQYQGEGLGRILIDKVCQKAKQYANESIQLNMNRKNTALSFYKRMGFNIIAEEDIDIGNGYLMEDYILEKQLS